MDKFIDKKKRSRNPENWIKTKRKLAILAGRQYLSTKGQLMPSKDIGPNCNCKSKCFQGVDKENRELIFNGFYSLKSYDEQNAYLYGLIRRHDVVRKRHTSSEKRTCSYKYFVRVKGREILVCKKAFANIHSISDKKIRTLCLKHEQNVMFPRDNRGRHSNRPNKVSEEVVRLVRQHIVHCLSGASALDFVKVDKTQAADINVSKLHKNYLQLHEPEAIDPHTYKIFKGHDTKVKAWVYFKVFHEEFKSLDFNFVKRKLCDVRKALELSGNSNCRIVKVTRARHMSKTAAPAQQDDASLLCSATTAAVAYSSPSHDATQLKEASQYGGGDQTPLITAPLNGTHNTVAVIPPMAAPLYTEQRHHLVTEGIPARLTAQVAPYTYQVTGSHQQQQQPLDLQLMPCSNATPRSVSIFNKQLDKQLTALPAQSVTIPSNGQAYYISLSSVPNIITVPPSACATVLSVTANNNNTNNRGYLTNNKGYVINSNTNALLTATLVSPGPPPPSSKPVLNLHNQHHTETAAITYCISQDGGNSYHHHSSSSLTASAVDLMQQQQQSRQLVACPTKPSSCSYIQQQSVDLSQSSGSVCSDGGRLQGLTVRAAPSSAVDTTIYNSSTALLHSGYATSQPQIIFQ